MLALTLLVVLVAASSAPAASGVRATVVGPSSPLVGERLSLRITGAPGREVRVQQRVAGRWKVVTRTKLSASGSAKSFIRVTTAGTVLLRAVSGTAASNVVRVAVRSNGKRLVERAGTVSLPASDVRDVVTVAGRSNVTLAAGAAVPKVGEVLVVPASKHSSGVLGRVESARGNSVVTKPVTLDQAYSTFSVAVSGTVGSLSRHNTVRLSQGESPTSATSFPLTCKTSGGTTVSPTVDLSAMHLEFDLTTVPPSIHFILEGTPKLGFQVQTTGNLSCSLKDPLPITILVPDTPILVKIAPRFDVSATGTTTVSVSWAPRVFIGFDRALGLAQDFHIIGGAATSVTANLTGHASAWFAGTLDVSVAGRVGVTGAFGPEATANATAPPPCVRINATLKATLDAYADVFFKNFTFSLASGTYGNLQLYRQCSSPPPPLFTVSNFAVCPFTDASISGYRRDGQPNFRCNRDYGSQINTTSSNSATSGFMCSATVTGDVTGIVYMWARNSDGGIAGYAPRDPASPVVDLWAGLWNVPFAQDFPPGQHNAECVVGEGITPTGPAATLAVRRFTVK